LIIFRHSKKDMNITQIDKIFRILIVYSAIALAVIDIIKPDFHSIIQDSFVVIMAGMVGYFTNFLAIKMLFQPKQGKVLGWEGLVPKNKAHIARSLGASVQTQLLSPEIILDYIHEKHMIENLTGKVANTVDRALNREEIRQKVTKAIINIIREKGPELIEGGFHISENFIITFTKSPDKVILFWHTIRDKILAFLDNQENRKNIADNLAKILLTEVPKIANLLNESLELYLEQRNALGKVGISLKKVANFDQEAIQEILEKFVEDPDTGEQFLGTLDVIMEKFCDRLRADETQTFIINKIESWAGSLSSFARENLVETGIEGLQNYFNDERNWDRIEKQILDLIHWSKDKILVFMDSEEGRNNIEVTLGRLIKRLNVSELVEEQVLKLDTDDLEEMILNNTGGNLVAIQFLGGVLGIIAGFVQVNKMFALPVLGLIILVMVEHMRNARRYGRI
jgi:uncharacterized membrane protein YheB (UPF0754 family)